MLKTQSWNSHIESQIIINFGQYDHPQILNNNKVNKHTPK